MIFHLFRINKTVEVDVTSAMLFNKQRVVLEKEFWMDEERKQHRKTHQERSFFEWFMLAIRCPAVGECAYLARE